MVLCEASFFFLNALRGLSPTSFRGIETRLIQKAEMESLDLLLMKFGQLVQQFFPFGKEIHPHDALVAFSMVFANQSAALSALHKADHGIVALLKKFRKFGDGRPPAAREPCNSKQQLVLLRRKAK